MHDAIDIWFDDGKHYADAGSGPIGPFDTSRDARVAYASVLVSEVCAGLAERVDDDNAQGWAADLELAYDVMTHGMTIRGAEDGRERNGSAAPDPADGLRAERISYGELIELQGLAGHIAPGDVELLEAAGVPEFPDDENLTDTWVRWYDAGRGVWGARAYVVNDDDGDAVRIEYTTNPGLPSEYHDVPRDSLDAPDAPTRVPLDAEVEAITDALGRMS